MTSINLQGTTIENEVIEICDTSAFNAIGSGTVLKDCELQIAVPSRALSITGSIIGGTIKAKRELHGFDWLDARLDGVTFKGRFKNNRFGNLPPMQRNGNVANCDFSNAILRDALFLNSACDGVDFGTWPQFTLRNCPELHASIAGCSDTTAIAHYFRFLSDYVKDYCDDSVTLNFMSIDATELCKTEKLDMEALQAWIESVESIIH